MSLHLLQFNDLTIHTITEKNGELWFKASDICKALGYSNSRDAIQKHVYTEDVAKRDTLTNGGSQKANFVNESGVYALIFGSNLPKAKEFKRWVTSEVLPALRKNGAYSADNSAQDKTTLGPVTLSHIVYFVRFIERHKTTFYKINDMLKVFNCFLIEATLYQVDAYLKPIERNYTGSIPEQIRWY